MTGWEIVLFIVLWSGSGMVITDIARRNLNRYFDLRSTWGADAVVLLTLVAVVGPVLGLAGVLASAGKWRSKTWKDEL